MIYDLNRLLYWMHDRKMIRSQATFFLFAEGGLVSSVHSSRRVMFAPLSCALYRQHTNLRLEAHQIVRVCGREQLSPLCRSV
jgi:hypothetical protein